MRKLMRVTALALGLPALMATGPVLAEQERTPGPADVEKVGEEAIIYGLPMSMFYSIMNAYAIDKDSGQYKAPFNEIANEPNATIVLVPSTAVDSMQLGGLTGVTAMATELSKKRPDRGSTKKAANE